MNKINLRGILFISICVISASFIGAERSRLELIVSSPWKPKAVFSDSNSIDLATLGMKNDLLIFNENHFWSATLSGQSVSGSWRLSNNDSILFMKNFNIKDSMNLNIIVLNNNFLNLWYFENTINKPIKIEINLTH